MDDVQISGLDELEAHIDELNADQTIPLREKLFDHVELQLTDGNIPPLMPRLLPRLTQLLKSASPTLDLGPPASLTTRLLSPLTFSQALALATPVSLTSALLSPSPPANLLAFAVLAKAAASPADAALLGGSDDGGDDDAMVALLRAALFRWLASPHVGVGESASKVLGDVLETDCPILPPPPPPATPPRTNGSAALNGLASDPSGLVLRRREVPGQGKVWALLLTDRAMLELVLALVSDVEPSPDEHVADGPVLLDPISGLPNGAALLGIAKLEIDARQRSLAQGRLLRLLPRLAALDYWAVATNGGAPDLFARYSATAAGAAPVGGGDAMDLDHDGASPSGGGLLHFAALHMLAAPTTDLLMHLSVVDFFEALVSVMRIATPPTSARIVGRPPRAATVASLSHLVAAFARLEAAAEAQAPGSSGPTRLLRSLRSLPDRTVPEEADALRAWLGELLPPQDRVFVVPRR